VSQKVVQTVVILIFCSCEFSSLGWDLIKVPPQIFMKQGN